MTSISTKPPLAPHSVPLRPGTPRSSSPRYWALLALVLGTAVLAYVFRWNIYNALVPDAQGWPRTLGYLGLAYLPWTLAILAVTAMVVGSRNVWEMLGLDRPFVPAIGFAFAITLILPVTYALSGGLKLADDSLHPLLTHALASGFFEELVYRAFLVGLLHRVFGWRFWPTVLVMAAVFGWLHVDQAESLGDKAMILLITGVGGVWFAWIYRAWGWNLWVPIAFHTLMNGWWIVFEVDDNALGTWGSIAARLAVVVLSVVLTLRLYPATSSSANA